MAVSFRLLLGLIPLLVVTSCGNSNHTPNTITTDTLGKQTTVGAASSPRHYTRNVLTDSMLSQITEYYRNEYGGDSIKMAIARSDSQTEVSFTQVPASADDGTWTLFLATISLVSEISPLLAGDMNHDGIADLMLTVPTEGGGGGGNVSWDDHFLFLGDSSGNYSLADMKSGMVLISGSGYFFPREITNQMITGVGLDYAETDGHCCPSLYYKVSVRYTNGELIMVDKIAISKPAGF